MNHQKANPGIKARMVSGVEVGMMKPPGGKATFGIKARMVSGVELGMMKPPVGKARMVSGVKVGVMKPPGGKAMMRELRRLSPRQMILEMELPKRRTRHYPPATRRSQITSQARFWIGQTK